MNEQMKHYIRRAIEEGEFNIPANSENMSRWVKLVLIYPEKYGDVLIIALELAIRDVR